ncbi:MAG: hypothetical protein E7317_12135, partial [Clostridiales bacterium]|nr:hypothetical protein [Clostridiales bacterium]
MKKFFTVLLCVLFMLFPTAALADGAVTAAPATDFADLLYESYGSTWRITDEEMLDAVSQGFVPADFDFTSLEIIDYFCLTVEHEPLDQDSITANLPVTATIPEGAKTLGMLCSFSGGMNWYAAGVTATDEGNADITLSAECLEAMRGAESNILFILSDRQAAAPAEADDAQFEKPPISVEAYDDEWFEHVRYAISSSNGDASVQFDTPATEAVLEALTEYDPVPGIPIDVYRSALTAGDVPAFVTYSAQGYLNMLCSVDISHADPAMGVSLDKEHFMQYRGTGYFGAAVLVEGSEK